MYFVVKVNGKKLYEYVRVGIEVECLKCMIIIEDIVLMIEIKFNGEIVSF